MSGLPGLDTYGPFITWLLLDQKISAQNIARIASEGPGDFFNEFLDSLNPKLPLFKKWGQGFGYLRANFSASFTILNLVKPITIEASGLKTKAAWSPFLGETFPGSLEAVFFAGKKI
jgi:dihydroorotase